ncbi:ead/Ea22-like family protein [Citrobacter portucalensis]|uniref:ead/Ea22-like family protein n=1 Tax=Citrobacter portucalensis TaxID=1639133 RepID=UPI001C63F38F|nr:ead/Ea22-like family protein [Citrobacter portucalensis]MBW7622482.1 ead/Ea22-like family protein [Citrobacter portucalensis]MBW7641434.1 ead/Ea22-like family protein [Citrobacter portucalensis]MCA2135951.1 ead/Ea22-like family protein [Citrobacter portucalensis]MCA2146129.1 ead/Ea22-like family protein [Citrobacter portucalensis]MCA2150937.1 ead/Ea22-like family protein [Citrobacter portucalensis]
MTALNKQALRERYSSQPVPKCHICGAEMTIQRAGGGSLVYGCTGRVDSDGEGYVFAEGRDFADNHYALSRVTVANDSDPDVLAMLDELEAAEERYEDMLRQARSFREAHDSASELIRKLERNKPVVKLPTTKLWAGKVACYEESEIIALLTAAGIGVKGE